MNYFLFNHWTSVRVGFIKINTEFAFMGAYEIFSTESFDKKYNKLQKDLKDRFKAQIKLLKGHSR